MLKQSCRVCTSIGCGILVLACCGTTVFGLQDSVIPQNPISPRPPGGSFDKRAREQAPGISPPPAKNWENPTDSNRSPTLLAGQMLVSIKAPNLLGPLRPGDFVDLVQPPAVPNLANSPSRMIAKNAQVFAINRSSTVTFLVAKEQGKAMLEALKTAPLKIVPRPKKQQPSSNQQMVDEINDLRRRMGGGVGESLKGLFENADTSNQTESPQAIFDQTIDDLARQLPSQGFGKQVQAPRNPLERERAHAVLQGSNRQIANNSPPPRDAGSGDSAPPSGSKSSVSRALALRSSARKLDQMAADMEEVGDYQSADQIRTLAHSLRMKARTSDKSGSSK